MTKTSFGEAVNLCKELLNSCMQCLHVQGLEQDFETSRRELVDVVERRSRQKRDSFEVWRGAMYELVNGVAAIENESCHIEQRQRKMRKLAEWEEQNGQS